MLDGGSVVYCGLWIWVCIGVEFLFWVLFDIVFCLPALCLLLGVLDSLFVCLLLFGVGFPICVIVWMSARGLIGVWCIVVIVL